MALQRIAKSAAAPTKPEKPPEEKPPAGSLRAAASPQGRPSAAREGRGAKLAKLVTRMLARAEPLWDEYDRLENELAMGDPSNTAEVKGFLRRAEKNSADCDLLAHASQIAEDEARAEREEALGGLRLKAKEDLEHERAKTGGKAPTIADIEAAMSSLYPDEMAKLKVAKSENKATVEHLFHLAQLWKQRAKTLEALLK